MTTLITGVAGFIGMHVAAALLDRGRPVVGIDNLNDYYDPALKRARLDRLCRRDGFAFERLDFSDRAAVLALAERHPAIARICHLGAQAGVRHSIDHPFDYADANLSGQLAVLELARRLMDRPGGLRALVYASSSSVYGASGPIPFSTAQRTDRPVSLYGATKVAGEAMAAAYAHLYRIPTVGLRFFTVYGPWGRPDMSPFLFTARILAGEPVRLFNRGRMKRDFTYIDDIVAGVLAALDRPPAAGADPPHRLYNLGNSRPVALLDYVAAIERACGRRAVIELTDAQPGDMAETCADIADSRRDLGFMPTVPIETGIRHFVDWYRGYYRV